MLAFFFGIDGGGTSCRAVVSRRDGEPLGEGRAGSANIMTDLEMARKNIGEAVDGAVEQAGLTASDISQCAAVLGLAGANIGDGAERLLPLLPFARSHVVTDARIALHGALGEMDGAVAILGTGSVFISQSHGTIRSIGGWGFAVGDFCSGARLGRTLLQEVLLTYDKVHEGSDLTRAVMESFEGNPETLVEYAHNAHPADFGTFAPILFDYEERGDPIARSIVNNALGDLEENLRTLIDADDLPFCLLGGLADNYAKRLRGDFKRRLLQAKASALDGALSLAISIFGDTEERTTRHG